MELTTASLKHALVRNTTLPEDEETVISNADITGYVLFYGRPCVWVIGTVGNTLSFLIFSRKSMRDSLTGFLFRWMAVFRFADLVHAALAGHLHASASGVF